MAVIKIEAKKDARSTQTICLIQGDRRTQILRFSVNRYDGGVDLMDLRWVIKTRNAAGVEDIYEPAAVEIGMTSITIDWLVDGSVTNDSGMADYELNGLDTAEDGEPIVWKGATGTISVRANIGPKFGETDGMTNIEKLILYVEEELDDVVEAGSAALDAAERANRAAGNVENISEAVESANAAAQRATNAAAAVEDLEGAVNRANTAAATATGGARSAEMAANTANSAAARATEAAKNVENIEEATMAAYQAAEDAHAAAGVANTAGLPAAMIYGLRVKGETAKASGNPVTFLPDAGSLIQPVTVLEPQQAGSGEPSPENIRSIISCDKLELGTRGKNIFPAWAESSYTMNGITFTKQADGSIRAQGTPAAYAYITLTDYKTLKEHGFAEGVHTISGLPVESDAWFVDLIGDANSPNINFYRNSAFDVSAELSRGGTYAWRIVITPNAGMIDLTFRIQVEAGSTPSSFAPCQSKIHTVQIGQTVCGGRMDWLTGKFVVTDELRTYNGSEGWFGNSGGNDSLFAISLDTTVNSVSACSHTPVVNETVPQNIIGSGYYTEYGVLYMNLTGGQRISIEEFRAKLAASPVQITYKLVNPIEIQLAPHIISAADPEQTNTLYGDGRIDVEYVKPLHVSIEERVAAALAAAKE